MKKINFILLIIIAVLLVSCTGNFEEFNKDSKNPTEVSGDALFTNAQKSLADQIASTNVNLNIWKLWAQYWTETTYTDEANYNVFNRKIPDNTFSTFYRSILNNLQQAKLNIEAEEVIGDAAKAEKTNKLAIIELLSSYATQRLVDIFGDVPYSTALKIGETLSPTYDDAFTIYKDLLSRVDAALSSMDDSNGSFGSADLYYGGDVALWKKFGNSLKFRLGLYLADVDAGLSKSTVEAAVSAGIISSDAESCKMNYLSGSPNTNPIHASLVLSGRKDFVPANTIVDKMNELNDPRRDDYFTLHDDVYVGGIYGVNSAFADYSHISSKISAAEFPCTLFDDVEMDFYLAEAAARGYSVGNAEDFYNAGVKASILNWGGTEDEATAYLATVPYNSGDWKNSIGTQAWLAYYTRGFLGYTTWRRLDAPQLNSSPDAQTEGGAIPTRFTYPINEQTLNKTNYEAASTAIGGDALLTKLFWDKN